ncbi:hypothetical protein KSS87_009467 [Heliosperma pusillum]|nr:hypothetical protein KSS87_009467 [Heliosperma pusillum]
MGSQKFMRPKLESGNNGGGDTSVSTNLYVANCGPSVGVSLDQISNAFSQFGHVINVCAADDTGTRIIVRNRDFVDVCLTDEELNISGLYLFHDFITPNEEKELLAAVDSRPWISLAKRRVQHYGYEFCYQTRNVDTQRYLGVLPSFVSPVLERVWTSSLEDATTINLDQLTVNEYPPGVGLSPHIDTHSAFEDKIFSLSLAGPCIMEFRRYHDGCWQSDSASKVMHGESFENSSNFVKKAVYLPPRSMLLLSGEARYAWHHYIPHHKVDNVKDNLIRRASRRVSFTLRKVRTEPCSCEYVKYCDSQR